MRHAKKLLLIGALGTLVPGLLAWTFLVTNFFGLNLDPTTFQAPGDQNVPVYQLATKKWTATTAPYTAPPDASTAVKGITKLDTAPAVASNPIAVGSNSAVLNPVPSGAGKVSIDTGSAYHAVGPGAANTLWHGNGAADPTFTKLFDADITANTITAGSLASTVTNRLMLTPATVGLIEVDGGAGNPPVALAQGAAGALLLSQGAAANPAMTAMSGDATITSGGVLTIGAAKITLADMANLSASRLIGRDSSGAGVPQALTLGTGLSITAGVINAATGTVAIKSGVTSIDASMDTATFDSTNFLVNNTASGKDNIQIATGGVTNTCLAASAVTDAKVSASAAIAYSKLALTASIVNADVAGSAAIAYSKLALSSSIVLADLATAVKSPAQTLDGTRKITTTAALALGTSASAGGGIDCAAADHVHPAPSLTENTNARGATTLTRLNGSGLSSSTAAGTTNVTVSNPLSSVSGGYVTRSGNNLLFAPDKSNRVMCYENGAWIDETIPDGGLTVACTSLNATATYTLFAVGNSYSGGTALTLSLDTGNNTVTQNGIPVKGGATNGTAIAICATDGSGAIRSFNEFANWQNICNYYNKRRICLYKAENSQTASYTYTTATWRAAHADLNNACFVCCDGNNHITARVAVRSNSSGGNSHATGIGIDSTTVDSAVIKTSCSNSVNAPSSSVYIGSPSVGKHIVTWLEYSVASNTTTWVTYTSIFESAGITLEGEF